MVDTRTYLSHLNINAIRLGLHPITKLLQTLGNPHLNFPSVLIGGTNGKGSIAAFLTNILKESGLKVGLYTSPHLIDLKERIRINEEMISDKELDDLGEEIIPIVKEELTYFEFLTACAFLYFQKKKVDIAVLEVGLGGRLDATNVVEPLVSIISNISMEHQQYLGRKLTDIAREKGGIIKQKGICISGVKQKQVRGILEDICREKKARLLFLGKDFRIRRIPAKGYTYFGLKQKWEDLALSLLGSYQWQNAALAMAAAEILQGLGFPIKEENIRTGLKKTKWEGRLEILNSSPLFIVDGGHNPAGISVLSRTLKKEIPYRNLILIFGALEDKNYSLMLKKLIPLATHIILTKPNTPRAVCAQKLAKLATIEGKREVEIYPVPKEAVKRAFALAQPTDLILATGSLYLVGEVKNLYLPQMVKQ